ATLLTRQDFNEFFFTHFLHSLFSGKDRDLKIQRQRVLYRGLTIFLHKQKKELLNVTLFFRRGSGIRTHDPLLPKRRDNKGYSATYQSIIMMRANHFKDSSKNALLGASF
ncbi:hypothetical protein, partial [Bacteroides thetaiotaomicron]|uniref:hypothetical protein n=1 Tax=Bacteroides thetaiotaomicron TaxID=818 RepID=UPI003DA2BB72